MNPFHTMIEVMHVINHGSFGWSTRSSWWPTRRWTCWLGCPPVPLDVHLHAMERPGKLFISSQQHNTLWCWYIKSSAWQPEMKRVAHFSFLWKFALVGGVSHGWKNACIPIHVHWHCEYTLEFHPEQHKSKICMYIWSSCKNIQHVLLESSKENNFLIATISILYTVARESVTTISRPRAWKSLFH